ncbi:MAG: F0F1 ATP synthase subunit delta [Patescibacteria group bacterium]|jgi:F0F1-type ATP synthase delta subunit
MKYTNAQYATALYAALKEKKAEEGAVLTHFVAELRKARKMRELPRILEKMQKLDDEAHGVIRVRMSTGKHLSESAETHIKKELADTLGKKIALTVDVDAAVLGGAKLRYADTSVNATARETLKQIQETLTK